MGIGGLGCGGRGEAPFRRGRGRERILTTNGGEGLARTGKGGEGGQTSILGMARRISDSVTQGNSSTPDSIRKHLNPFTPALANGTKSSYTLFRISKPKTHKKPQKTNLIPRDNPTPKPNIDPTLTLCCLDLFV